MKKLNRKGFTLVELLAVIIILAIVVGISIPAITSVINNSKNNALGVAVDAAADYLSDQFGYYNIDTTTASEAFKNVITGPVTSAEDLSYSDEKEAALLNAMGFTENNVNTVLFTIDASGVACVTVTSVDTAGEYYSTAHFTASGDAATPKDTAEYFSRNCAAALTK